MLLKRVVIKNQALQELKGTLGVLYSNIFFGIITVQLHEQHYDY